MAFNDLFKPAWQSKDYKKCKKALAKLKKEETIFEAAKFYYHNYSIFIDLFVRLSKPEYIQLYLLNLYFESDNYKLKNKVDEYVLTIISGLKNELIAQHTELHEKIARLFHKDIGFYTKKSLHPFLADEEIEIIYKNLKGFEEKYKFLKEIRKDQKEKIWPKFIASFPDWKQTLEEKEKKLKEEREMDKLWDKGLENWSNMD